MSRAQLQQIALIAFLLLFALVWTLTRKLPETASLQTPPPVLLPKAVTPPEEKPEATPPAVPLEKETPVARNPFELPKLLKEVWQQKELARERQEQERLEREQESRDSQKAVPEQPPPSLELQGILWTAREPKAIINRQIVSVGDSLPGNVEVTSITKDRVRVSYPGGNIELTLPQKSSGSRSRESEEGTP
ncbi:MAG: hypothetical protein HYZ90_04250 [Candidatus Omnitrophica bacterium]|nr:hypothetical protein [Candidatus Omnitrophota bacterium]